MKKLLWLLALSLAGIVFSATPSPSGEPTSFPSGEPTCIPTSVPTSPSGEPTTVPTSPSGEPTSVPTSPSGEPTTVPTSPSGEPTGEPTIRPSGEPTNVPSSIPSGQPSQEPTGEPSGQPTEEPSGEPTGEPTSIPTAIPTQPYYIRFGDKFGDGWNGVRLCLLRDYDNSTRLRDDSAFNDVDDQYKFAPAVGERGYEIASSCIADEVVKLAFCYNNSLLTALGPPIQSWELYFQIEKNGNVLHGGWNTHIIFKCGNRNGTRADLLLASTVNLMEPLSSCPQCQHPKPKAKSKGGKDDKPKDDKPKGGKDDKSHFKLTSRRLDKKEKQSNKPNRKESATKYWPVPIKLYDMQDRDGWFQSGSLVYAEYTISDASRYNLVAEGTLCVDNNGPRGGYSELCEVLLPDGHYIFRASGNLDNDSLNYTWQLCGKEAVKYEAGRSTPVVGENATVIYDFREATGRIGNEVSFIIKNGKCIVDDNVITIADYVNSSALDTVVIIGGHFLFDDVYFTNLTADQSRFLEADIAEFISFFHVSRRIVLQSVVAMESGTLVGYQVIATHAELALMDGVLDEMVEAAGENLESQMTSGAFLTVLRSILQAAGRSTDELMNVKSVTFVDLELTSVVTLRDGKMASGETVAGTEHDLLITPDVILSDVKTETSAEKAVLMDFVAALGAVAVVAVIALLAVNVLKVDSAVPEMDNSSTIDTSSTNLVPRVVADSMPSNVPKKDFTSTFVAPPTVDSFTTLPRPSGPRSVPSYQDSLSVALSQRWELNAEEESVRL